MGQHFSCPQRTRARNPANTPKGPTAEAAEAGPTYWGLVAQFWAEQLPPTVANVLETYEGSAYAYVEDWIAVALFNRSNTAAWLGFAVTFVVRPFAGLVCGVAADEFGRRRVLLASLYIMFGATVGQGLAPAVPYLGAAWMFACRVLQGFGSAGQVGSFTVMMTESAPPPAMGHAAAMISVSGWLGFIVALAISTALNYALSPAQMLRWGWRVPFLLTALPGGLVLYYAHATHESAAFEREHREPEDGGARVDHMKADLKATVLGHWRTGLLGTAGVLGVSSLQYLYSVYFRQWLVQACGMSTLQASQVVLAGTAVAVIAAVPVAVLADTCGIGTTVATMPLCAIATAVPAYAALYYDPGSPAAVGVAGVVVPGALTALGALTNVWATELFPFEVRGAAFSLYYNVGVVAGGLTPFVCSSFKAVPLFPGYYTVAVSSVALAAMVATLWLHRAHRADQQRLQVVHIRADPY